MKNVFLLLTFAIIALPSVYAKGHNHHCHHCHKRYPQRRLYYDVSTGILSNSIGSVEVFRPVPYRAGRDLKIEIDQYNPLQYQLSINDSSTSLFLNDTALISKYLVTPNLPASAAAAEAAAPAPAAPAGAKNGQRITRTAKKKTATTKNKSCNDLAEQQKKLDADKTDLLVAINIYNIFCSKIDMINGAFTNLKGLDILTPAAVKGELVNFVASLNTFLTSNGHAVLNADPAEVSTGELSEAEQFYYKKVNSISQDINKIKLAIDALADDGCSGFAVSYKNVNNNITNVQKLVSDFNTNYTGKVLPTFNSTMTVFGQLRPLLKSIPPFVSKAVTITGDETYLKINKKMTGQDQSTNIDIISVQPVRGFKIDVAGGIFFSGLADKAYSKRSMDSIYTKKYLVSGQQRDTTVQENFSAIYEKKQIPVSFGGMVYLHAHSQNMGYVNYGVSLGFGALFNDQARFTMSLGPTLSLGKTQHLNINAGIIMAQVDRLADPYRTGVWYNEPLDNIPTFKSWQTSWMLGLSWNLK